MFQAINLLFSNNKSTYRDKMATITQNKCLLTHGNAT